MTIWDDRILEYISDFDSATPKELDNSGFVKVSRSQISRRLRKLTDNGLLQHLGNGVYVITDEGEAYLAEEYDVDQGVYLDDSDENADASSIKSDS